MVAPRLHQPLTSGRIDGPLVLSRPQGLTAEVATACGIFAGPTARRETEATRGRVTDGSDRLVHRHTRNAEPRKPRASSRVGGLASVSTRSLNDRPRRAEHSLSACHTPAFVCDRERRLDPCSRCGPSEAGVSDARGETPLGAQRRTPRPALECSWQAPSGSEPVKSSLRGSSKASSGSGSVAHVRHWRRWSSARRSPSSPGGRATAWLVRDADVRRTCSSVEASSSSVCSRVASPC